MGILMQDNFSTSMNLILENIRTLRQELRDSTSYNKQELKEIKDSVNTALNRSQEQGFEIQNIKTRTNDNDSRLASLETRVIAFESMLKTFKYLKTILICIATVTSTILTILFNIYFKYYKGM